MRSGRRCYRCDGMSTPAPTLLLLRILPIQDDGVVSQLELSAEGV